MPPAVSFKAGSRANKPSGLGSRDAKLRMHEADVPDDASGIEKVASLSIRGCGNSSFFVGLRQVLKIPLLYTQRLSLRCRRGVIDGWFDRGA